MPGTYNITALKKQTVFEIALQEYGSLDGVRIILEDNPGLSIFIGQPLGGRSIVCRFDSTIDKKVVAQYKKENIKPANVNYYISATGGETKVGENLSLIYNE